MESLKEIDTTKLYSKIGDFLLIKTLGSGLNSKVKLAFKMSDSKYYALKFPKKKENLQKNKGTIIQEVELMRQMKHPFLISLIDFHENGIYEKKNGSTFETIFAVLELAVSGTLFDYIFDGHFSEKISRTYFHQLIQALEYLHQNNIAHRDLKPENLLLSDNFDLKIADFGFSKFQKDFLKTKLLGTKGYQAPELLEDRPFNYDGKLVDIFASGVILFVMYAGSPPFTEANSKDNYYKCIISESYSTFWTYHSSYYKKGFFSDSFKNLIDGMLSYDPAKRFSISKIKEHPWYKGDISDINDLKQEFVKKRENVEIALEEERKNNEIIKMKKKKKLEEKDKLIQNGPMPFLRGSSEKNNIFFDIENKFETELKTQRILKIREQKVIWSLTDIFTVCEIEDLFKIVLDVFFKEKTVQDINISKNDYKITIKINDYENDIIEIQSQFFFINTNTTIIEFNKKKGNQIIYSKKVKYIKSLIEKSIENFQKIN